MDESKDSFPGERLDASISSVNKEVMGDIFQDARVSEELLSFYQSFIDFYLQHVEAENHDPLLDDFERSAKKASSKF